MRLRMLVPLAVGLVASACVAGTPTPAPPTTTTVPQPDRIAAIDAGLPEWNDRVFYEVFVRSFADSDGDGIGDLVGLTERLDHLNDGDPETTTDLGITGIWLMPIFESPSYHGYDVTDYLTVDPDYGTQGDFEAFVRAAHERGIHVILDLVINHTSVEHPWFVEASEPASEKSDWYEFSDTDPRWPGPWGQRVWHPLDERWYYGLFWSGMPDLALTEPGPTNELLFVARHWLDLGVDGFRLDAARHLIEDGPVQEDTLETKQWLTRFRDDLRSTHPDVLIVGEVWSDTQTVAGYVPDSIDLGFEFDLSDAVLTGLERGNAEFLRVATGSASGSYPPGQVATFLSNHDQDRVMSRLDRRWPAAAAAATWLMTSEGVPFVYYGEEVGMRGDKPDENIRTPMPWTDEVGKVGFTSGRPWWQPYPGYAEANVGTQSDDPESLLSHYRDLIGYRTGSNPLRLGTTDIVDSGTAGVFAMVRTHGDERVLVVINLDDEPVSDYALALDQTATAASALGREVAADAGPGYRPVEELAPFESLVIELSPN